MDSDDTRNAISSVESPDGPMRSSLPGGMQLGLFGPEAVPVNRFQSPDLARGKKTSGTCGQPSPTSLSSYDLQRSLESRLRQKMDVNGSPEYVLTWKRWDMPSGPPICALRASVRRTSGKGCSGWRSPMECDYKNMDCATQGYLCKQARTVGWPTATANDATGSQYAYAGGNHGKPVLKLPGAAQTAGWPTPRTITGGAESAERKKELGRMESGGGDLQAVAFGTMPSGTNAPMGGSEGFPAGWTTPQAWEPGGTSMRPSRLATGRTTEYLSRQVEMTQPKSGLKLNPRFSLWLMGYPIEWASCAERVTPLFRKLQRNL